MRTIESGNPYTREEHIRTAYNAKDLENMSTEECEWCGSVNRYGGLFEYNGTGHYFCSKGCYRTYTC